MKFCNYDISKTITARSFKLGQLIKEMSRLPGENKKKKFMINVTTLILKLSISHF